MIKYYIVAVLSVLLASVAQILLKIGANQVGRRGRLADIYLNKYTILGAILFMAVTFMSIYALQKIDLKELVFILPMSYVWVPILAKIFLKEEFSRQRIFGIVIILCGMIFFNLDKL